MNPNIKFPEGRSWDQVETWSAAEDRFHCIFEDGTEFSLPSPTQVLFTESVTKIIAQGQAAYNLEVRECQLRAPGGRACAVGMVINDLHYDPDMEATASPRNFAALPLRRAIASSYPDLNLDPNNHRGSYWRMLTGLQSAHDKADDRDFIHDFSLLAGEIALEFNLEMPDV